MDASKLIDQAIARAPDWRGEVMKTVRRLIHEVDPSVVEEWKWMGTPTWNHDGIICVANAHKTAVRMTFPRGAQINDPKHVFNAELAGNVRRAIKWEQGDTVDVEGVKGLVRSAIALNSEKPAARNAKASNNVTGYLPGVKRPAMKKPATKRAAPKKSR